MELRPISDLAGWYARELSEAFPENERKPLADMVSEMERGCYEPLGLYEGQALLGYATLWSREAFPGYVLLDYLGVTAGRRNGGLGAAILRLLGERYAGRALIITEAEAPVPGGPEAENALRLRRIGFYERCGFAPVYDIGSCGVRFRALVLGRMPAGMEVLMAAHRAIYGPGRPDAKIPLGPGETPEPPYWMKGRN